MRLIGLVIVVAACGAPVARNVPAPNKAAAAGIAAGAAAAITLADPKAAAATQEERKTPADLREQKSGGTVPADVLDRLDEKQKRRTNAPGAVETDPESVAPGAEP